MKLPSASIPSHDEAIAAFSGGVDSIFTLLRHGTKQFGAASYPLKKTVLMVHGFDVPLEKPEQLETLQRRTAPLLMELGFELKTMRTNLKELQLQDWEDSSMSQLAGCLHNYSHQFSYGLVGSTESYDALVLPWGSNPATDHLLSGAHMRIVHDGAGYSRTAKVEQIARHATAASVVKVCWEGEETSRNCGECEKCVRTLLNFLAVGVSNPACFSKPLDKRQIRALILRHDTAHGELKSIVNYAKAKGITEDWLLELDKRVRRYKGPTFLQKHAPRLQRAWALAQRGEWRQLAGKVRTKAWGSVFGVSLRGVKDGRPATAKVLGETPAIAANARGRNVNRHIVS